LAIVCSQSIRALEMQDASLHHLLSRKRNEFSLRERYRRAGSGPAGCINHFARFGEGWQPDTTPCHPERSVIFSLAKDRA
jgi:hypothetical protein